MLWRALDRSFRTISANIQWTHDLEGVCTEGSLKTVPRHRWEDNLKMDHKETGWKNVGWIRQAPDIGKWLDLVNMVINLRVMRSF
jgi:hypothetical protein